MSRIFSFVVVLGVSLAMAPATRAQSMHEDSKLGYKIRTPKDFSEIPLKPDEDWIVGRWLSDRAYYQTDPTNGFSFDHKPELHVIAFQDAAVNADRVEVKKKTDAETSVVHLLSLNPYKDYRDFLKRTYNEGGYFIDKEEKTEVEGVKVECLEIKVERGTWGGPRRIITWIFDGPATDFAVQFELVESAWGKLKKDVLATMRSFRLIAATGGVAATTGTGTAVIDVDAGTSGWDKLTPSQRALKRLDSQEHEQTKATQGLIEGWSAKRMGRVFVIYDVDEKFARSYATDATAVLDYLDAQFPWLGEGEYVREPTIRVCKSSDERSMYQKGSGWSFGREIVTYKDLDRGIGWSWSESGQVNRAVFEHWFRERSGELLYVMPRWLESGLETAFSKSRAKGKGLEFYNDSWERVDIAEQIHSGKISPLRDLIQLEGEEIWKQENKSDECAAAVRFFLTGPRRAKDALKVYMQALAPLAKQREDERRADIESNSKSAKPKTEEEEDAAFKAAHAKINDGEKKFLQEAFTQSFGTWTDADWKSLDVAYQKSLK